MADTKLTDLSAFAQFAPATDVMEVVDISDTTLDASGTNKKVGVNLLKYGGFSGLQGKGPLQFNSTTVLRVLTHRIGINGKDVSFTQTDYTSGSTMKDIANSTVTLGASKGYYVFESDAGVIGIEDIDGTGDGAVCVFDTALDYWKAASTGVAWRRIGKFLTNASSLIVKFIVTGQGRVRRYLDTSGGAITLVNAGTQTSLTSVTVTPYISADDDFLFLSVGVAHATTGAAEIDISVDNAGNMLFFANGNANTNISYSGVVTPLPNTGSLHYKVLANNTGSIWLVGYEHYV